MANEKDKPAKSWEVTIYGHTEETLEKFRSWSNDVTRMVISEETCPSTGRVHLQCKFVFKRAYRMTQLRKLIGPYHVERSRAPQDALYCKKLDGKLLIEVDNRKQGARGDLNAVKEEIIGGRRVDDIAMERPTVYHQYGRTLMKLEDIVMRKKFRVEMTEGIWIYGPTGVGKSHEAFKDFSPDTHYLYPKDGDWWDAYTQQETVVFNEFRGDVPYSRLLELVDKWPMNVRRRGREPMPFTSKRVVVTSCMLPHEVYRNMHERDSLRQLYRRFKVFYKPDTESPFVEWDPVSHGFA